MTSARLSAQLSRMTAKAPLRYKVAAMVVIEAAK